MTLNREDGYASDMIGIATYALDAYQQTQERHRFENDESTRFILQGRMQALAHVFELATGRDVLDHDAREIAGRVGD